MSNGLEKCGFNVLNEKIERAAKIISVIPEVQNLAKDETNLSVAIRVVEACLQRLGVYRDDTSHDLLMSEHITEGVARSVFCEGEYRIPVPRFKMLWSVLREGKESNEKEEERFSFNDSMKELVGALKPIGQRPDKELLEKYGPSCEMLIVEELLKRSHGRAFVMFQDEKTGKINTERTLELLRHARRDVQMPAVMTATSAGGPLFRLYKAGEFPQCEEHVCPVHNNIVLVDGYCDECKTVWSGLSDKLQKFFKIANDLKELPTSRFELRKLVALAEENVDELFAALPMAALRFKECDSENTLPSLRLRVANRPCDPLNVHRSY